MADIANFAAFIPVAIAWDAGIHAFLDQMSAMTGLGFQWFNAENILAEITNQGNFDNFFEHTVPALGHILVQAIDNPITQIPIRALHLLKDEVVNGSRPWKQQQGQQEEEQGNEDDGDEDDGDEEDGDEDGDDDEEDED
ncbi:acidic leucine-rich nuclear phosphoprotein 32 family member B [Rhipicephalus sanguineus]|uniref:acidic leucine-rich nuclear phosphoprotein 32 family member B n=1 Tax=Rhipicephalus sanguineus TaxID=34632 RepID=UPI001895EF99|nr:acidic leucine-rich nuclear phosphoprotein 32 family member B [Rhipicephalus sanguineus]